MFSLPNIARMNAQAVAEFEETVRAAQEPQEHACDVCRWRGDVLDEEGDVLPECRADHAYEWYDPFSDDPKGVIYLCDRHDGCSGSPMEGYFTCEGCGRVFIENYTWERYEALAPDGPRCPACAMRLYLGEDAGFIPTTGATGGPVVSKVVVEQVSGDVQNYGYEPVYDHRRDEINLGACQHLLVVGQEMPRGFTEVGHVTLDGDREIYGGDPTASVLGILAEAREAGAEEVLAVLSGAYQFCVDISFYALDRAEYEAGLREGERLADDRRARRREAAAPLVAARERARREAAGQLALAV